MRSVFIVIMRAHTCYELNLKYRIEDQTDQSYGHVFL